MFKHKDEKGLTLIELLITISVLAVVSAIALPVINNVVTSSNSNALQQTIKDADAFIKKYSASGVVLYDGLKTITGYVDTDGDNVIEAGEKMDSLTLDSKYSISVTGSAQIGGSYTNGGVTSAVITSSASGSTNAGGGSGNTPVTDGSVDPLMPMHASIPAPYGNGWFLSGNSATFGSVQAGDTLLLQSSLVNVGSLNIDISGTYTVQAVQTYTAGNSEIMVAIWLDPSFESAFQGTSGMWASSWGMSTDMAFVTR